MRNLTDWLLVDEVDLKQDGIGALSSFKLVATKPELVPCAVDAEGPFRNRFARCPPARGYRPGRLRVRKE